MTSAPDRRRNLRNGWLDLHGHEDHGIGLITEAAQVFAFKRQRNHLTKVCNDLVEVLALCHRVQFRALPHEAGLLTRSDDRMNRVLHDASLRYPVA